MSGAAATRVFESAVPLPNAPARRLAYAPNGRKTSKPVDVNVLEMTTTTAATMNASTIARSGIDATCQSSRATLRSRITRENRRSP